MKLAKIPVRFDQEGHTYENTLTGEFYQGITSTLLRRLFPEKYDGIPEEVLQKAAERGTTVHEDIECTETLGVEPLTEEGRNYLDLKAANGMEFLASEYTVSDLQHFATNIDAVYKVDEETVDLADFKTTYKLDEDAVSWQLSFCAHFFELNNPTIKVRNLYGIWLRGDVAKRVTVPRKPETALLEVMQAEIEGKEIEKAAIPATIAEKQERLYVLGKRIAAMTAEQDLLKAELLAEMKGGGLKSVDAGRVLCTVLAPQERQSFDANRFKAEHGDLYAQYTKTVTTKESLKVTLRD